MEFENKNRINEIPNNSNIAIVGGGRICRDILKIILSNNFDQNLNVIGVADINSKAMGLEYAKNKRIFTTNDYTELFGIKDLNVIIELTGDDKVLEELKLTKPKNVKLIDHSTAIPVWNHLQISEKVKRIKSDLTKHINNPEKIEEKFDQFTSELTKIVEERTRYFLKIEKDLKERTHNVQITEKDLTERVKALYEESREKYNLLFETHPNPIFIIDRQTYKILDVNSRAQVCYGYTKNELLNMSFLELGDKKDKELTNRLENLSEGQCTFFSKKKHYRKGLSPFHVNINFCFSKYNEDNAFIATTTDISESIEKEIQLIQASKMTTLGTMAAGVAHELNQPLNVIQVGADFFLKKIKRGDTIDTGDLHTIASEIHTNVQRAAEIINQLRDFARQSDIVGSKTDINEPILDVCKLLAQQLRVHQIELELDLNGNLPPIMSDHNRLVQVFMNLMTNAVDALDEKGEKLGDIQWKRLLSIKSFSRNDQVIVTVTDTGAGIPEEIQEKIFEPFFTTKDVSKGTGLGISLSYSIVKDFGGTIDVRSEINMGTTFELSFQSCSKDD